MYEEARRMLLEEHGYDCVLGYFILNGDSWVKKKMDKANAVHLSMHERAELLQIATAKHDWLGYVHLRDGYRTEDSLVEAVRQLIPGKSEKVVMHYDMNGADDVLKYKKWFNASRTNMMITMCRPGSTEELRKHVREAQEDGYAQSPYFLVGPELPDISSTLARTALSRGDRAGAVKLLDEGVVDWLISHGRTRRGDSPPDTCSEGTPKPDGGGDTTMIRAPGAAKPRHRPSRHRLQ